MRTISAIIKKRPVNMLLPEPTVEMLKAIQIDMNATSFSEAVRRIIEERYKLIQVTEKKAD